MSVAPKILQLKIRLLGISPMVWRRVLVPSPVSLRELHGIFQVAMGWEGTHLYHFDIRAVDYGPWELSAASPDTPLGGFDFRKNDRFSYIYDMGDYWRHDVRVEAFLDANPKKTYPNCTGGAGACPPEDCGGADGFLSCRDEVQGYDAWLDLDILAGFAKDLLERHDTNQTLEGLDLEEIKPALERMQIREPYLEHSFSRKHVNKQFRDGAHLRLQHQQIM